MSRLPLPLLPNCTIRIPFKGLTWRDLRRIVDVGGHYDNDDDVVFYWDTLGHGDLEGIEMVPYTGVPVEDER